MEYKAYTARGNRVANEDAYVCVERDGNFCFVVADGVSSHGRGEVASQKVTEVFAREFGKRAEGCLKFLSRAFEAAQTDVVAMQQTTDEMKTTAVALAVMRNKYAWGHIGDSRIYYFRKGKLKQRSLDHSVAQMLLLSSGDGDVDLASHPDRNCLFRVIGEKWNEPRYELSKVARFKRGDAFLLCTDGVWELVTAKKLCELLNQSETASGWLDCIISEVEQNGRNIDMDNYTAIAVIVKT